MKYFWDEGTRVNYPYPTLYAFASRPIRQYTSLDPTSIVVPLPGQGWRPQESAEVPQHGTASPAVTQCVAKRHIHIPSNEVEMYTNPTTASLV